MMILINQQNAHHQHQKENSNKTKIGTMIIEVQHILTRAAGCPII
jgi:hypothetical protein